MPRSRGTELDVRTVLDHRQYIEVRPAHLSFIFDRLKLTLSLPSAQIPSFMFLTLSWCMWFTFAQIGSAHINPTSWPLIWFVFVVALMANPAPIFFRDSRYWFAK